MFTLAFARDKRAEEGSRSAKLPGSVQLAHGDRDWALRQASRRYMYVWSVEGEASWAASRHIDTHSLPSVIG